MRSHPVLGFQVQIMLRTRHIKTILDTMSFRQGDIEAAHALTTVLKSLESDECQMCCAIGVTLKAQNVGMHIVEVFVEGTEGLPGSPDVSDGVVMVDEPILDVVDGKNFLT